MEPTVKSEPCEDLYREQENYYQVAGGPQECEKSLQQPQQIKKRLHEEMEDPRESSGNINHKQANDSYYQSFEFPSIPHHIQDSSHYQATMVPDGKPLKKHKRLEANVLFNPPFFNLVEEIILPSNKEAIAARCYSCSKIVKGNRGISSNFIKHMKRAHPEIYKLYDNYKTHKIKLYQLQNIAKNIGVKSIPTMENGASGSDSTTANDDTNQFFEVNTVLETSVINDSSDDNDDSVIAIKEIVESSEQNGQSSKSLEVLNKVIDKKLKGFVKQKDYDQLIEKVNALTNRNTTVEVDPSSTVAELKIDLDNLKKECAELRCAMQKSQASKRQLQNELETVDKLLHQRKLIIRNITVHNSDQLLESIQKLFKETLNLVDIKIINCSIIPSAKSSLDSSKESVCIELGSRQDCKAIFREIHKLKNTGIFIESEISPFQRKRKNKLMVLRKELLRRKPELKVLVRETTLVVNGKNFYWDDVEGLCHDCKYEVLQLNGVEYLNKLSGLDIKEFINVLQNYNVQIF